MSLFKKTFATERMAFVPYVTFADPDIDGFERILLKLAEKGADIIEVGIPYSDPMADGEINRQSSDRALKNDVCLSDCLESLSRLRATGFSPPIVLFGYLNSFLQFGIEKLSQVASELAIAGVLIVDLPFESSRAIQKKLKVGGVELIPLVSPTTSELRLKEIGEKAGGFVYCVARTGVTGQQTDLDHQFAAYLSRVRKCISQPIAVGFGISQVNQIKALNRLCDAIVVGSAIVERVGHSSFAKEKSTSEIEDFVVPLIEATKENKNVRASC